MALSKRQKRVLRKNGILIDNNSIPQCGMKLVNVTPKTFSQRQTFEAYDAGDQLLLHGTAGTGKTFISLYLALDEIFNIKNPSYNNITIVRSIVPTRDIGFLPGKEEEKMSVYEAPYRSICNDLFRRDDAYDILKHKGIINFMCTSYIRGVTLRNSIVVVDEIQNLSGHELSSVITRLGEDCRILLCGDFSQTDLTKERERDGLKKFIRIIDYMNDFEHIEFNRHDIVRSQLVKNFICAQEDLGLSLSYG